MKDFEPAYATREITLNGRAYRVREPSLDEFDRFLATRANGTKNANVQATVELVEAALLEPRHTAEQLRKVGLGTLLKLGNEIINAAGLGGDEKKEPEKDSATD